MGESINDQLNKNRTNSKLKVLYKISMAKWMLNHGTTRFKTHYMNSALVETWEAFMVSAGNIIRDNLAKTCLLPISPTNMIKNTQACVSSITTSSKGIDIIVEDTLSPIELLTTRTNDPMVII